MGHLFSKKKSRVTEQDRAVLQLKTTRDKIRQYQKRSELQLLKDRELAKLLLQNHKKERAKLLLRKKRFIEEQLNKTDGQLSNIERMIQDVEFAQIELKVVDCLKVGNEALKMINNLLSIEDIERILDETQEAAQKQEEINLMLCGFAAEGATLSEDELEDELAALIGDILPDATPLPDQPLPDVPQDEPKEEMEEAQAATPSAQKERRRVAVEAS